MSTKLHIRTDDMGEQVRHGEVCEVHVGGRVHVLVLDDDETRHDVAEDADREDDRVEHADRHDRREREVGRAEPLLDVGRQVRGRLHRAELAELAEGRGRDIIGRRRRERE